MAGTRRIPLISNHAASNVLDMHIFACALVIGLFQVNSHMHNSFQTGCLMESIFDPLIAARNLKYPFG
jgi:hypothetical protein